MVRRVMLRRRVLSSLLVAGALGLSSSVVFADDDDPEAPPDDATKYADALQGYVPGAAALEGRIMAPCCWTQTIDIHGSEIAIDLRLEIRRRLKAGETPEAIEASLVQRYGERILAVPPGSPLKSVATLLALGFAGAGGGALVMLKRWRARGSGEKPKPKSKPQGKPADDAQLDARLDAELEALDD